MCSYQNSLICAAFIVMMMVVFFSFRHVENVLRTSFASETRRIMENSNITRELTRVMSDMSLILRTFYDHMREKKHPILESIDDLQLRLRTLTAVAPSIAEYGQNLIHLLKEHNESVLKFHRTVERLGKMLEENGHEKENLFLMMERSDREIAKKSAEATDALTALIYRSMETTLFIFLGILPIAILGGVTAYSIKKPVNRVIEYIRRLSKGEIPEQIEDEYKGEFELVMNYLNMLIRATNSVTQIAESIAAGDMKIVARERSGNDRLMQALNRMIQRLDQIISETRDMIRSVGEGHMDIHGNTEPFEGGWRELVSGMNDLIEGMSIAVSETSALHQEMELARNIETCLLPTAVEKIDPEFEIAASMLPADQAGGDFYEITLDRSGNLRIAIGDVSGHGVTPGLIMMMAQTIHSTLVANFDSDTRDTVIKINEILYTMAFCRQSEKAQKVFHINSIVSEVVKMMSDLTPSDIDIRSDISNRELLIKGDPTQIHQVVTNLITNSVHALSGKGGTIDVILKTADIVKEQQGTIVLTPPEPGVYAEITVKDNGPGIDNTIIHNIFDPFFTTKPMGQGSGMGLAVVHGIIRGHKGSVSVESEPGKGAAFHCYFPVIKEKEKNSEHYVALKDAGTGDERILIVDDEPMILEVCSESLGSMGYHVTACEESRKALEILKTQPEEFDLIITDNTMPDMSGTELSREIRKILPYIPIILITGNLLIRDSDLEKAGIQAFIQKPFDIIKLQSVVRNVLDGAVGLKRDAHLRGM